MSQKISKHWNTMVDILEGQFPKGKCKERGRALVMIAYIKMMMMGAEFDENGEPRKSESNQNKDKK